MRCFAGWREGRSRRRSRHRRWRRSRRRRAERGCSAQVLPDVLDRVQFGRVGRQRQERDVVGGTRARRCVPAGAVEQEDGMGAGGDGRPISARCRSIASAVGLGQHQGGADAARRADGAEQVGPVVAAVARRARARAAAGPEPGDGALLADPGFVLEPDLERLAVGGWRGGPAITRRRSFFERLLRRLVGCGCAGAPTAA